MKILAAIDPGKHNIGIAVFRDAILQRAWLAPTKDFPNTLPGVEHVDDVAVEKMQIYRGSVAAPLVELAIISSEIAGAMRYAYDARVHYYLPAQWKGQADKSVIHDRARRALSDEEIARIELPRAKKTQLDVLDAVALGLAHLQKTGARFGRVRAA